MGIMNAPPPSICEVTKGPILTSGLLPSGRVRNTLCEPNERAQPLWEEVLLVNWALTAGPPSQLLTKVPTESPALVVPGLSHLPSPQVVAWMPHLRPNEQGTELLLVPQFVTISHLVLIGETCRPVLPTQLPNEKHMEATHNVRITTRPFLVDGVIDISKQDIPGILLCIFWGRFRYCSKPRSSERSPDNFSRADLKNISSYPDGNCVISPDINTGLKLCSMAPRLMDSRNKAIGYNKRFQYN